MPPMKRYQNGTLEEVNTAAGLCWYIRFTSPDGKRPRFRVGLKAQFPTKAKASRAAQHLRDEFNASPEAILAQARTFGDVIERYEREEMPQRYSTARGYEKLHRVHIRPQWGDTPLSDLNPMQVRAWILKLDKSSRTKGHIHSQMRMLCRYAMLWGWLPAQANPMSLFTIPGATRRKKTPRVIPPEVFAKMLAAETRPRYRAMLVGGYCKGLRVSELFGLKWKDFDWLNHSLTISRAVVEGHVGDVKTERSGAALPLDGYVLNVFLAWYQAATFREANDWVFSNAKGTAPIDNRWLPQEWLTPLAKTAGVSFPMGWHTLRHSYKSLLDRVTQDATVKRDLMRHADVHTTMQVYGQVEMDRMRTANEAAMALIFQMPLDCPGAPARD